jgi:UDP-glucose 4-epimerase
MKRVIVTGGAGFIGSNLVDKLIEKGIEVIIIDNLSTGKEENINLKAEFEKCDITQKDQLQKIFEKYDNIDVIFHTSALARVQPSIEDPLNYNNNNVNGTLNLLYLAKEFKISRFIYSASSSAYGNTEIYPTPETAPTDPLSPYGLQKYIGEQYCRVFSEVYGLDTVSLRYFNVYGERMSLEGAYKLVLGIFAQQKLEGKPLTITNDGNQRRDFTYVGDVVDANILAATKKEQFSGDVFNIGNGDNYSINEVADMMGGPKKYIGERLEPHQTLADNKKAKLILGWNPQGNLEKWIKKYKQKLGI